MLVDKTGQVVTTFPVMGHVDMVDMDKVIMMIVQQGLYFLFHPVIEIFTD